MAAGGVAIEGWTRRCSSCAAAIVAATFAAWLFFRRSRCRCSPNRRCELLRLRRPACCTSIARRSRPSTIVRRRCRRIGPTCTAGPSSPPTVAQDLLRSAGRRSATQAAIVASNYGEAAAIDFFGARYGLPPALSGHNNYWLWGPRGYSGNVVIDVNGDCGRHDDPTSFAARGSPRASTAPWVISYEQNIPISVCIGITKPLAEIWPKLRHYI